MVAIAKTLERPLLDRLVDAITLAYEGQDDDEARVAAIAGALRPFLGERRLLSPAQRESSPDRYRQHVLHVDPRGLFSVAALVWRAGQGTSIHDHVAWCVVGVHEGCEREVTYRLVGEGEGSYLVPVGEAINWPGSVGALTPPGDVHRVENPGPKLAISIHVYGADLRRIGTSIRRRYELEVRESAARV